MAHWIITPRNRDDCCIVDVSDCNSRVQEARLFAALLESGWGLKVNSTQFQAISGIAPFFSITYSPYAGENCQSINIEIDHQTPRTRFGHVERPLVFPEWIYSSVSTTHSSRAVPCSFEGYPAKRRVKAAWSLIEKSGKSNLPIQRHIVNLALKVNYIPLRCRILNSVFTAELCRRGWQFRWTSGGRKISNKIYDVSYWQMLQESKTVYCPAGDFGWTYRFYEAILAGAIPIVDFTSSGDFVKGFVVCQSFDEYLSLQDSLQVILDNNLILAIQHVTARAELDPRNFVS
jgi:hypothetical protein